MVIGKCKRGKAPPNMEMGRGRRTEKGAEGRGKGEHGQGGMMYDGDQSLMIDDG